MKLSARLGHLPRATIQGRSVAVATSVRGRLLGLAYLDRGAAGQGLLIPRCSSVHTFGMRFDLDLFFLDEWGDLLDMRRDVPPRRFAFVRGAHAVLEIPAREGGEFPAAPA